MLQVVWFNPSVQVAFLLAVGRWWTFYSSEDYEGHQKADETTEQEKHLKAQEPEGQKWQMFNVYVLGIYTAKYEGL